MLWLVRIQTTYILWSDGDTNTGYEYDKFLGYSSACPDGCYNRMFETIQGTHTALPLEAKKPTPMEVITRAEVLWKELFYKAPYKTREKMIILYQKVGNERAAEKAKQEFKKFSNEQRELLKKTLLAEYPETWKKTLLGDQYLGAIDSNWEYLFCLDGITAKKPEEPKKPKDPKKVAADVARVLALLPHHLIVAPVVLLNTAVVAAATALYTPILLLDSALYYSQIPYVIHNYLGGKHWHRWILDKVYVPAYQRLHKGKKPSGYPYEPKLFNSWWGSPLERLGNLAIFLFTPARWGQQSIKAAYGTKYAHLRRIAQSLPKPSWNIEAPQINWELKPITIPSWLKRKKTEVSADANASNTSSFNDVDGNYSSDNILGALNHTPTRRITRSQRKRMQVLNIVKENGYNLENYPEYQNDKEIVQAAVNDSPYAAQYASPELRNDVAFMRPLIQQKPSVFAQASPVVRNDLQTAKMAIAQDPMLIRNVGSNLKQNRDLAILAVTKDGCTLEYLASRFRNDPELVATALSPEGKLNGVASADYSDALEKILEQYKNEQSSQRQRSRRHHDFWASDDGTKPAEPPYAPSYGYVRLLR